jgi:uncharacterized protein YbjT (DUF2867 family)
MYVITGATGNTGSVVAEKLLAKGGEVRVVGRDAKRLERGVSLSWLRSGDGRELLLAFW